MTQVGGIDILLAWVEFAVFVGGGLAILLHRSGRAGRSDRPGPDTPRDDDEP